MAVASGDLRQRKIAKSFEALDVTGRGTVSMSDLEDQVRRIAAEFGAAADSPQFARLLDADARCWRELVKCVGKSPEQELTMDEYVQGITRLRQQDIRKALTQYAEALFEMVDNNRDGRISRDEFVRYAKAIGVSSEDAGAVFQRMDSDGDGELSRTEFARNMYDFFAGSDVKATGNELIGRL
ncbi:Ca2+-binding protein, EF-hand superfamily [Streptoalloteichus tenebrarius]|uniref:Ca2+-binding protein, EF-hand superfamily n=1 Tax=Streptoalloteichus tenebrarius (strain ATCC 17920 / DSM 40477 / JCM 4838 / CBS 697.72 / NBRC 16177 / NCIMB 11028 / NRRL B-12390 / A12253. 1 / ISP 5477) TaxID=1933 RepID=A0ABT1HSM7_STRSD|nr:EF-hand domain-containing protein [Streptoalloteichus tenebrarius]MCP2258523.1 Ca2+-binding protein, EF-hand superfamily [Streptoalloteichus tenebrarius]BFF04114.1 EF-hand domain-containing protein [Streptoalloteichus tenebrarius]